MKKYNVIKIAAKIILIMLITLTSVEAAILIGFNWSAYFWVTKETDGDAYAYAADDIGMGGVAFQIGIFLLFIDIIWVILFFILLKNRKRRNNPTCLINET